MVRTQIPLTDDQARAVRELAEREGRSVADIVRECLDARLRSSQGERQEVKQRAVAVTGRFFSGISDLGKNHDQYAAESFAQ